MENQVSQVAPRTEMILEARPMQEVNPATFSQPLDKQRQTLRSTVLLEHSVTGVGLEQFGIPVQLPTKAEKTMHLWEFVTRSEFDGEWRLGGRAREGQ